MRIGIQAENLTGTRDARHAGIGRYSFAIIDHLLAIGDEHEWTLYVRDTFEPPETWLERENFHVARIGNRMRLWFGLQRTPSALMRRLDVFFVLSGAPMNHRLIRQAATIHDLFPFDYPEYFPADVIARSQRVHRDQIVKSDLLFAVSEDTKRRIVDRFGIAPDRIVVTPNGPGNALPRVEGPISPERLAELGVSFPRYFFTLSTLEPRKNLSRLLEAMALLRAQPTHADVGLVVGGGKGWKESSIFEAVERLGLQNAVAFLGYVPDEHLPELFAGAQAAVCASLDEGFGIPVLEGMLYGVPVVTSNAGALPEVGGDAVTYFDPIEPAAIAAAMAHVLSPEFDRKAAIARGLERASQFQWSKTAEITLRELERLGRGAHARGPAPR